MEESSTGYIKCCSWCSCTYTNISIRRGSNATGYIQTLFNTSTATDAGTPTSSSDALLIELGTLDANRTTGNTFIGFADSTGTLAGAIVGGASAVAYDTTGAVVPVSRKLVEVIL